MNTFRYRIRTFFQYKDLIKELVSRDIKLKYRRSFLGYIWSVLNPLLIMIVMTVVFSAMFKRNIENYPVYLLIGRMTYDFLTTSTNGAMRSVTGAAWACPSCTGNTPRPSCTARRNRHPGYVPR